MSEENKKDSRRYLGKVKVYDTKYGQAQKIYMDSLNHENADGTPNKYYKGALIWADAITGKNYQVKQMSIFVPKDGMDPALLAKGFSCFVTLDLNDDYQVTVLG